MPSEELAAEMTARYVADTDAPRPRAARPRAAGRRDDRADRRPDRRPGRLRPRLRGGRRRVLPRGELPRLRQALQPPARGDAAGRGRRRGRAQGEPARLRALEGAQGGRGHRLARPVGRGPAGLAHRVLGDGRAAAGHRLRDPRRRLGPGVPPPRERDRPDRGGARASRWPASGCTTGWCGWATEKMAKSVGNIRLLHEALDEYGRDALVMYFASGHYRQPIAFSRRGAGGGRPGGGAAARARPAAGPRRRPRRRASTPTPSASSTALADDFNTPAARAVLFEWVARGQPPPGRRRGRGARAPRRDAPRARAREPARGGRGEAPTPRPSACWPSARRPGRRRDFERADRAARRAGRARLGGARHPGGRRGWSRRRDRLRPQPGARGAARAPRTCSGLGHAAAAEVRAVAGEARASARAATDELERAVRVAGPPGGLRRGRALPLRGRRTSLLEADDALVVCLDEVQDPHNLGAVCRVAESAGRGRRGDPRAPLGRGHARGLQGVGRRGRAPARWRACATWPTGWRAAKDARGLGLRRRGRSRSGALRPARLPRAGRAGARLGGPGAAPARGREPATSWSRCPSAGGSGRSTCPPPRRPWCTGSCNCANAGLDRGP